VAKIDAQCVLACVDRTQPVTLAQHGRLRIAPPLDYLGST